MSEIIERKVTRYLCPHCRRGFMKAAAARVHTMRCSRNQANRSCRTCEHYCKASKDEVDYEFVWTPGEPEACAESVQDIVNYRLDNGDYPLQCEGYLSRRAAQ